MAPQEPESSDMGTNTTPPSDATESNVVPLSAEDFPVQCTGHNRQGNRCRRAPVPGLTVCHYHGGAAPQTRDKAAERLAQARDMALERFIEFVADDGDIADPAILLSAIDKLSAKVELLQGRATQRTEVDERVHYEQVRVDLIARLDDLAERHRRGIERPQDPEPGALPEPVDVESRESVPGEDPE